MCFIPAPVRGVISFLGYAANTLFWCPILFVVAFFKWIVPFPWWRSFCSRILTWIAESWIAVNDINSRLVNLIHWEVDGADNLRRDGCYMVMSNHQSWTDILVLQSIFNRRIPFMRFFIKKELIWVPVMGLAWWALDFPFMKRYSEAFLNKYPHLKGKDLETTQRACEKFKTLPVSIMNFVEGTRVTPEKHKMQSSPYSNLLRPKAGGASFVLQAMGDRLHQILDVTIVYPHGYKSFWHFLSGRIKTIKVRVQTLPVDSFLIGDYTSDSEYRKRFQTWLNEIWANKDLQIGHMLQADGRQKKGLFQEV
jgi:1-acyl-sn-glycerol-3-phosphate acyltransferase